VHHLHQKYQIEDYQSKDRLSVCMILLLQRQPKPGRTKHSAGPHRVPWVGHSWSSLVRRSNKNSSS